MHFNALATLSSSCVYVCSTCSNQNADSCTYSKKACHDDMKPQKTAALTAMYDATMQSKLKEDLREANACTGIVGAGRPALGCAQTSRKPPAHPSRAPLGTAEFHAENSARARRDALHNTLQDSTSEYQESPSRRLRHLSPVPVDCRRPPRKDTGHSTCPRQRRHQTRSRPTPG